MSPETVADMLAQLTGSGITAVDGGFRVKETPTHYIDVLRMIFNWRIATTPKDEPLTLDGGWCYYGTDWTTLLRAVHAAIEWDGAPGTRPEGWDKDAIAGEYARHG